MTKDVKSARPRPTVANLEKRVEAIETSAATKEDLHELETAIAMRIEQLGNVMRDRGESHHGATLDYLGAQFDETHSVITERHKESLTAIKANSDIASVTQKALTAHEKAQREFAIDCLARLKRAHDAIRALTKLFRPFLIGGAVAVVVFVALFLIWAA